MAVHSGKLPVGQNSLRTQALSSVAHTGNCDEVGALGAASGIECDDFTGVNGIGVVRRRPINRGTTTVADNF